jgi:hypothetical protein
MAVERSNATVVVYSPKVIVQLAVHKEEVEAATEVGDAQEDIADWTELIDRVT